MTFKVPERHRVTNGPMPSDARYGNNGMFHIENLRRQLMRAIASDGDGWEHVSVSLPGLKRCPKWKEMAYMKQMFWDKEDLVVQYHPIESEYVNHHPYTLHMWRKCGTNDFCETPPSYMVGPK